MELLNPVDLERQIVETVNSISNSIRKVSDAYDAWKTAELAFKADYAMAYMGAEGSIEDRKQMATLQTGESADELRIAEVKYKRLLDYQKAYRDKLSAFQTLQKSVSDAYRMAGRGEAA